MSALRPLSIVVSASIASIVALSGDLDGPAERVPRESGGITSVYTR